MQTPGVIRSSTTVALAVSLAVSLAVAAGAVAQPAPVSSDWKTLRTPHLTVVGDASAGELQRLGRDIERFRDAIASAVPAVRFDETIPTVLVVFRSDASMRPFKPRARGKTMDFVDAYLFGAPDVHYIVLTATNTMPWRPAGAVAHDGAEHGRRDATAVACRLSVGLPRLRRRCDPPKPAPVAGVARDGTARVLRNPSTSVTSIGAPSSAARWCTTC